MKPTHDPALLQRVREQFCLVCGDTPCDPDHVKTRGAGGGDTIDNVMPLCRRHHTERGTLGIASMVNKYPGIYRWMVTHGREDILEKATRFNRG